MQIIGVLATGVVVAGVLLATAVALKSIPDIKHYRRIKPWHDTDCPARNDVSRTP